MNKNFNFIKLLEDHAISLEQPNNRGYIQIQCPFCFDTGMHGGLHQSGYYTCFKCGNHRLDELIKILTGENWRDIQDRYETDIINNTEKKQAKQTEIIFPDGTGPLNERHYKYLFDRKFNPKYIERKYNLMATDIYGEYSFRIIIPIYYNRKIVSYLGRDWTNKSQMRYKACRIENEVIHHKHILYNLDNAITQHCVVVEGSTDVWRLGDGSVATLGTGYTERQINVLTKRFNHITLIFDSEPEAVKRAEKLGTILAGFIKTVDIITLKDGDPGSMDQYEADAMMEEIYEGKR